VQNIGRYAVVADPQGAAFGVYHPKRAVKAPAQRPQRGEFAWQELATSDFEAAFRFYSDLFGWQTLQRMDMGPAGSDLIFGVNGVRMGGIYKLSAQTPAPFWLSYISVPDVDAAVAQARELGARVVNGPMDVPDEGRIAQLLDSSGVLFAVHSRASAAANSAADAPKPKPKAPPRAKQPSAASPTSTPAAERAKAALLAPAAGAAAAPAAKKAVKKSARKSAKKAAKPVSSGSAKKPAGKSVPKVTKKAAKKKAAKKPAKKPAKKAAKKAGKKAAKKASKRPTRGGAGKSARKSARKVAKKSKRPRRGK
jgi:predicted enzyme related to lactoylglutathione lyase